MSQFNPRRQRQVFNVFISILCFVLGMSVQNISTVLNSDSLRQEPLDEQVEAEHRTRRTIATEEAIDQSANITAAILASPSAKKPLTVGDNTDTPTTIASARIASEKMVRGPPLSIQELTGLDKNVDPEGCKHPFVPIVDKIVDDPYAGGRKIPRYVHLAWITDSGRGRCIHHLQADVIKKWADALPNYSIFFHSNNAVETLLKPENWPEFPHLTTVLRCAKMKSAMLIDIWRVLLLYRYGGIYTDMDRYPGPKFTEDTIPLEADFFSASDIANRPSQFGFGMAPKHPVGLFTMHEILSRILKLDDIALPKLVKTTGPEALKGGWSKTFGYNFSPGTWPGKFNTTALKVRRLHDYFPTNSEDKLNDGTNLTIREKIQADSGSIHWTLEQWRLKKKVPRVSCLDYLYMLEQEKD